MFDIDEQNEIRYCLTAQREAVRDLLPDIDVKNDIRWLV